MEDDAYRLPPILVPGHEQAAHVQGPSVGYYPSTPNLSRNIRARSDSQVPSPGNKTPRSEHSIDVVSARKVTELKTREDRLSKAEAYVDQQIQELGAIEARQAALARAEAEVNQRAEMLNAVQLSASQGQQLARQLHLRTMDRDSIERRFREGQVENQQTQQWLRNQIAAIDREINRHWPPMQQDEERQHQAGRHHWQGELQRRLEESQEQERAYHRELANLLWKEYGV